MDSQSTDRLDVTGQPIPSPVGLCKIHWFQLVNALDSLLYLYLENCHDDHLLLTQIEIMLDEGVVLAWNVMLQEQWDHSELMSSYPNTMSRLGDLVTWWDREQQYDKTDDLWVESVEDFHDLMTAIGGLIDQMNTLRKKR